MIVDRQLVICAIASVAGHFAFARGLDYLPAHDDRIDEATQSDGRKEFK